MRILITGGAGFIGSHTARFLSQQGHDVTIFDLREDARYGRSVTGDIRDFAAIEHAVAGHDAVVHLAAEVSVPKTVEDPALAEQVNALGSLNVLKAAKAAGCTKVVLASSAAVYGENPRTPTKETERPRPMSPYAVSKLAMEDYAARYAAQGLPTCCLRFFNVYGPGQKADSQYAAVIPAFIARASRGEPLTIYGDGEQTRDFIFVEDVARAIGLALTRGEGVLNIATGTSVTINELARLIIALTGSSSAITHAPVRSGDPRTSLADVSRARIELGFEAKESLEQGLNATADSTTVAARAAGATPAGSGKH